MRIGAGTLVFGLVGFTSSCKVIALLTTGGSHVYLDGLHEVYVHTSSLVDGVLGGEEPLV